MTELTFHFGKVLTIMLRKFHKTFQLSKSVIGAEVFVKHTMIVSYSYIFFVMR